MNQLIMWSESLSNSKTNPLWTRRWPQGHPELDSLRGNYYRWLTETGQDEKAGEVKESEGDFQGAINLYLKAGLPAKAARLAISRQEITSNSDTVSRIAASLIKGEFYERVSGLCLHLAFISDPSSSSFLLTDARRGEETTEEQHFFSLFTQFYTVASSICPLSLWVFP